MKDNDIKISKFLSLILRHKPETIGIQLDPNGWVAVDELIAKVNAKGTKLDRALLDHIVATNPKKRFTYNDTLDKIRASQGHSIDVELGYTNQKPPEILFHGTSDKNVASILEKGLEKRNRQHVHLSTDHITAIKVGQRHGTPVVLQVLAEHMYLDGFEFYLSDNGVWLTGHVPAKYLRDPHEG